MRIILFDIDGTLLLTGRAGLHAIRAAMLEQFGITDLQPVEVHGRTDRGIARELFAAHGLDDSDANWLAFRNRYVHHLAHELPQREGFVLPGVMELLEQLVQQEHVHLGLLTGNVEAGARLKLKHYDLDHYFPFGGFGDLHAERNDVAAQAKQHAIDHCGPVDSPDQVWVIGDTPNDIRCARSIGARVVAVATGGASREELDRHQPDISIENLEAADLLARLIGD